MTELQSVLLVAAVFVAVLLIFRAGKKADTSPVAADLGDPQAWEIGPADYPGGNPSQGVPLHPLPHPEGWCIDIPQAPGSVHYVTVRRGSLSSMVAMELRGRIETAPGVVLVPAKFQPGVPAQITPYFQREGDTWSGTGGYEFFRWFCTSATITGIGAGEFVIRGQFDQRWTPVDGPKDSRSAPAEFAAALAMTHRIGFVLGGGDGYGHGVYATGPARLVITSVKVE